MVLKSTSQEPQSRSMLCRVRSEVVRGPGVSRYGSVVIGCSLFRRLYGAPQERRGLAREHAGLVDANHFDRGPAVRRANAGIDPHTRIVGLPVELDAKPLEAAQDPAAYLRGVLADAAAESDHVDPAELAHIRRHIMPGTPTEYLDRKLRTRIAPLLERQQLAHVGAAAGETEETTFGIELAAHLRRGQAAELHDVEPRAGIHVPRARTHDQTFKRRESHAGRQRV